MDKKPSPDDVIKEWKAELLKHALGAAKHGVGHINTLYLGAKVEMRWMDMEPGKYVVTAIDPQTLKVELREVKS